MNIIFVAMHILGAVLGTGGATFAEIFSIKALRDGVVEPIEADYLKTVYVIIRIGLILTILSGFGFLFLYRVGGHSEFIYNVKLWAKLTVIIILTLNAILLQAHKMPFWLGGPISFVSWYTALFLGIFRKIDAGYFTIMLWYVVALIVCIVAFRSIRKALGIKV